LTSDRARDRLGAIVYREESFRQFSVFSFQFSVFDQVGYVTN
jgi:hypothetical protein